MHDFDFSRSDLSASALPGHVDTHHTESNFALKVINFAAANKSWRLVCNSGNINSCKAHCSRQFPGDALSIEECTKAVTEAFTGTGFACFPMNSVVTRKSGGIIPLSELRIGDEILVPAERGIKYDTVVAFLHWDEVVKEKFVSVRFGQGYLNIHRDHLVPIVSQGKASFIKASSVKPGDVIRTLWIDGSLCETVVIEVDLIEETGLCCPLTSSGMVIVDSVACSCYASPGGLLPVDLGHSVCHAAMAPLRLKYSFSGSQKPAKPAGGIHPYAKALMTAATGVLFA